MTTTAWTLLIIVLATSPKWQEPSDPHTPAIGAQVVLSNYIPNIHSIDFGDEASCEAAAKKLREDKMAGIQAAICLQRGPK